MNTRYTVTQSGIWWDVRRPTGQRVTTYPTGSWHAAIHEAHALSTVDQIRDVKHRELFGEPCPRPGIDLQGFVDHILGSIKRPNRASDYVLAN